MDVVNPIGAGVVLSPYHNHNDALASHPAICAYAIDLYGWNTMKMTLSIICFLT